MLLWRPMSTWHEAVWCQGVQQQGWAVRATCLQQFLLLSTALYVLQSFCGGVGWELVGVQYMVEEEMGKEKEK